jgi:hypothetical protein
MKFSRLYIKNLQKGVKTAKETLRESVVQNK